MDIVKFESEELQDIKHDWNQRVSEKLASDLSDEEKLKSSIKRRNKIVIVTPTTALQLFQNKLLGTDKATCFTLVVDKMNMHQAFDSDQDLLELLRTKGFPSSNDVVFKTIFTTNSKSEKDSVMDE